jgi:nucleotide-binding universal stress UspA family protein
MTSRWLIVAPARSTVPSIGLWVGRNMGAKIVVGLDGGGAKFRALPYAKKLASLIGECELVLVHVVEWSPFTFQTAQENAERHKRREEEVAEATRTILDPAIEPLRREGFAARGVVKHGKVAEVLDQIAAEEGADQIVIGRSAGEGLAERVFGSTTESLVRHANVPVTVVG